VPVGARRGFLCTFAGFEHVLVGKEFQVASVADAINSEAEIEQRPDDWKRPGDKYPEDCGAGVAAALKAVQSYEYKGDEVEDTLDQQNKRSFYHAGNSNAQKCFGNKKQDCRSLI
jgi:hypothetical protein